MTIQINTDSSSPDGSNTPGDYQPARRKKGLLVVIGVTVLLHVVAAVFAWMYFPDWRSSASGAKGNQVAVDANSSASTDSSSKSSAAMESPSTESKPKDFDASVEKKVLDLVDEAEARDDSENRTVLEQKAAELTDISSPESIERMAPVLTNALNLKPRATAPAETPPEGPFDPKSAQFHSVRRVTKENGKIRYVSVMVDAEGRSIEIELSEAEGESVYKTMKLVEENPLLEKVYRQLVIPAMDKATQNRD